MYWLFPKLQGLRVFAIALFLLAGEAKNGAASLSAQHLGHRKEKGSRMKSLVSRNWMHPLRAIALSAEKKRESELLEKSVI